MTKKQYFSTQDSDFQQVVAALLQRRHQLSDEDLRRQVRAIIADVQQRGDTALLDYTRRFDQSQAELTDLCLTRAMIQDYCQQVPLAQKNALQHAANRIRAFHQEGYPPLEQYYQDSDDMRLGWRWLPLDSVGVYVPGGQASYPSSVLMNAIPASLVGVERIAMVMPAPGGVVNPLTIMAASIAGVHEIYLVGGAQAVAALAYGTSMIAPVDKIVGPGNRYVAEAKRQVFGAVGIDMVAGPSEVLIIADEHADPDWICVDLMAQMEHDTAAQAILVTDSAMLAEKVAQRLPILMQDMPRQEIIAQSWQDYGAIILASSLEEAVRISNKFAPEHLELAVSDPDSLMPCIRHAGTIFMGHYTPEALGDYIAGCNHVLPTCGAARFSSGLSSLDFMKRTTIVNASVDGLRSIGPDAALLADCEGLQAHARSVRQRLDRLSEV